MDSCRLIYYARKYYVAGVVLNLLLPRVKVVIKLGVARGRSGVLDPQSKDNYFSSRKCTV